MKSNLAIALSVILIFLASCSSPKDIVYFSDVKPGNELRLAASSQIKIKPLDQLQIIVSTADQRLTDQLNLSMGSNSVNSSQSGIGYTVDSKGDIQFPMLGRIKAAGLTREQLAETIREDLIRRNLVKDPVVIVQYDNFGVSVLGEVNSPGRVQIKKDKVTVLEALAQAGDLTINGQRRNVLVMRNNGDTETVYAVDLTDARGLCASPAYYLQQDDVIYVAPNDKAARNSTSNGNTFQTPAFWMSFITFLMSVGVMVFK